MSQDPDKSQNSKQNVNDSESKSQADGLDTSGELIRKRIRQSTPSPHRGNTPQSGSPPRFVSLEELMETAEGVTNMTLAHEIVVNGDFQIKPTKLPEGSFLFIVSSSSFSLDEALATLSEKICEEVKNCLSQHGFTPFSADKEQGLKGQIMAVAKPDNSIRKVLDSRVQTFLKSYLVSSHQKSIPVIPGGLTLIQKELEEIAVKYIRLVNYNKMVFSPYYDTIITEILNKDDSH
nr:PREDICTED: T-complex protein 11-like protein 1 [Latimeria chalumnae]|eukprot:XP_014341171.1 PREDICTED: T-complex protein 11-like protein 1 [Latimeria chalumnae]